MYIYIYIIYKPPYYLRGASPRRPGGNSPCASVRRWSWSAASGWAPAWPCGWPRPGWWNVGKKVGKSRKNPRNPWENVETPRNVENTFKILEHDRFLVFFFCGRCVFGGFLIDFCWGCGIFRDLWGDAATSDAGAFCKPVPKLFFGRLSLGLPPWATCTCHGHLLGK